MDISYLKNDYEKAQYLQNLLISYSTDGIVDNSEYIFLRDYFLNIKQLENKIPDCVRLYKDLGQFWQFIKYKCRTYDERRKFLWDSFSSLLDYLDVKSNLVISNETIIQKLEKYGSNSIYQELQKAHERKKNDPDGAITSSRTILESVCKFILDEKQIPYLENTELSVLYKQTSKELHLSVDEHNEEIFKQILGGCSAIINGLGSLRNRLGDAHGKGKLHTKPKERHAELAVNLAGGMAFFLLDTYYENKESDLSEK